jgi:putative ABC transport system permease protein
VRKALGADAMSVVALVVRQGVAWMAGGVAAGALGARLLSRSIESLLFEVKATDALTFLAVALLLATVALIASVVPAIRASRVDPMLALRSE